MKCVRHCEIQHNKFREYGQNMAFYDDVKTAQQYIEMADGYDGRELVSVLKKYLPDGARVLELGMGPGIDLNMLNKHFNATGSDNSQFFLDRYQDIDSGADLIYLDAVGLETERQFDCIYSNKVLHHLTEEELVASLSRQKEVLSMPGLIMHSFWCGTGIEEHHGLRFVYQTEDKIRSIVNDFFTVVDIVVYKEMDEGDSLYVLATT